MYYVDCCLLQIAAETRGSRGKSQNTPHRVETVNALQARPPGISNNQQNVIEA